MVAGKHVPSKWKCSECHELMSIRGYKPDEFFKGETKFLCHNCNKWVVPAQLEETKNEQSN